MTKPKADGGAATMRSAIKEGRVAADVAARFPATQSKDGSLAGRVPVF